MQERDHGGGLDAAVARYGGGRNDWLDLSTGINPLPYVTRDLDWQDAWTALPDAGAMQVLEQAARRFWRIPAEAGIVAAPGASALIAQIPYLLPPAAVNIPTPTYNEHAASFAQAGWSVEDTVSQAQVIVHPNNPDGRVWTANDVTAPFAVIDESFCDVMPEASLIDLAATSGRIVLKSFGKFWGLAGLRLGFAVGDPVLIAQLRERMGPWAVSGPALRIGAAALADDAWADDTRQRLAHDAARLDAALVAAGAANPRGTSLFRLYDVADAAAWQDRLAQKHIWTRIFPYSKTMIRLGLPAPADWPRLRAAL